MVELQYFRFLALLFCLAVLSVGSAFANSVDPGVDSTVFEHTEDANAVYRRRTVAAWAGGAAAIVGPPVVFLGATMLTGNEPTHRIGIGLMVAGYLCGLSGPPILSLSARSAMRGLGQVGFVDTVSSTVSLTLWITEIVVLVPMQLVGDGRARFALFLGAMTCHVGAIVSGIMQLRRNRRRFQSKHIPVIEPYFAPSKVDGESVYGFSAVFRW